MMTDQDLDWALDHEPPDGGLAALQTRLDAPRRRWGWGVVTLAGAALAVLIMSLVAPAPPQVPQGWMSDPSLVALDGGTLPGVRAVPGGDDRIALAEVIVEQEGVVMARVATARGRLPDATP